MRSFVRPFLGLLALAALALPAHAQGVAIQQSATKLDAATTVCTISYSSGTTFVVNVATTATCTPPAGKYVYITSVNIDVCTNGTGTAGNQQSFTSTNLTGSPTWTYSIAATASICQHIAESYPTGLKSTAAGTAVTIVSPSAATNNSYMIRALAYYAD